MASKKFIFKSNICRFSFIIAEKNIDKGRKNTPYAAQCEDFQNSCMSRTLYDKQKLLGKSAKIQINILIKYL